METSTYNKEKPLIFRKNDLSWIGRFDVEFGIVAIFGSCLIPFQAVVDPSDDDAWQGFSIFNFSFPCKAKKRIFFVTKNNIIFLAKKNIILLVGLVTPWCPEGFRSRQWSGRK